VKTSDTRHEGSQTVAAVKAVVRLPWVAYAFSILLGMGIALLVMALLGRLS